MDIALNKDFEIIKKASSTVLCNELSRCVYEGYKKSSKRNYKVTDKMISIFKFLYKVRIATKDQINRYLTLNGYTNVSEEFLNILNMKYGTLSYIDCKNDKTTRVYAPAVGMLYILDKYTSLEINENTDEYVFQQNINNSFINKEQSEILKGIILTELYLDIIQNSVKAISQADTLIIGGTSLVVYPAAGLINYFRGNNLVLINKSTTSADNKADLVIHDSIGKVLYEAVKSL